MDTVCHLIATDCLNDLEYRRICQLDQIGRACQERGDLEGFVHYIRRAEAASRQWVRQIELPHGGRFIENSR